MIIKVWTLRSVLVDVVFAKKIRIREKTWKIGRRRWRGRRLPVRVWTAVVGAEKVWTVDRLVGLVAGVGDVVGAVDR